MYMVYCERAPRCPRYDTKNCGGARYIHVRYQSDCQNVRERKTKTHRDDENRQGRALALWLLGGNGQRGRRG